MLYQISTKMLETHFSKNTELNRQEVLFYIDLLITQGKESVALEFLKGIFSLIY